MQLVAIQYKPPKGKPQIARQELSALIQESGEKGSGIIVCPEMAITGYVWDSKEEVLPFCEQADGETFQLLAPLAKKYRSWIVCGIAEKEGDRLYNSAIVINSSGELAGCYRKILLFEQDETWATAGTERMLFNTEFGTMAPAICMDLNDNDLIYWLWKARPDILAFCTNWLNEGTTIDDYWMLRTPHWYGWMIGANCWGTDRHIEFRGESAIISPEKKTLLKAPITGNVIISCNITKEDT
jgi:N-carbamoylputrescine amidase